MSSEKPCLDLLAGVHTFNWQRFWCPPDSNYCLDHFGFLKDPTEKYGEYGQPDVIDAEEALKKSCIAFLAEPGMGKTTEIQRYYENTKKILEDSEDEVLYFSLQTYTSGTRLEKKIFESTEFQRWQSKDYNLHLFLDSLDECHIQTIAGLLIELLKDSQCDFKRLKLRIACRTAQWPQQLETHLPKLWPAEEYQKLELLPLRKRDIEEVLEQVDIESGSFFSAVRASNAESIAMKPITLKIPTSRV